MSRITHQISALDYSYLIVLQSIRFSSVTVLLDMFGNIYSPLSSTGKVPLANVSNNKTRNNIIGNPNWLTLSMLLFFKYLPLSNEQIALL